MTSKCIKKNSSNALPRIKAYSSNVSRYSISFNQPTVNKCFKSHKLPLPSAMHLKPHKFLS